MGCDHLGQDFDAIFALDLGGNVRKNPKLSGTTHNVFGIQVGVSINLFIETAHETANAAKSITPELMNTGGKSRNTIFSKNNPFEVR